jgi:alpha-tubulin suppressor-like RCC1 family protein
VAVSGGLAFQALSAGDYHTCGLTTSGAAYCWGLNVSGQLGDGTTANRASPVAVSGGLVFQALRAGRYHTCGLTASGAGYCWGDNSSGQLGDGTGFRVSPVAVVGGVVFGAPPRILGTPSLGRSP